MDPTVRRLYLAGPMAGRTDHNFLLFNRVAQLLRRQGYEVFNPAENKDGGLRRPRAFYMRLDIPALMESDAVVVLPGWEQSRGASLEVWIAIDLELPVCQYSEVGETVELKRIEGLQLGSLPFLGEAIDLSPPTVS
ncbi:MAG: DUF4406 domain-containing protein [Planctomycetota bacterium]